jgi:hypothetical protein
MLSLSLIAFIVWRIEQEEPLETGGEGGTEDGDTASYISVLGCLMGIVTLITSYIAWKTKDVQAELSESSWIFYDIFSHIQV